MSQSYGVKHEEKPAPRQLKNAWLGAAKEIQNEHFENDFSHDVSDP